MHYGNHIYEADDARKIFNIVNITAAHMKVNLALTKQDMLVRGGGKKAEAQKALEQYQSTLKVHVIRSPDAPDARDLMKRMYKLYERTFPIDEERETFDKLLSLLERNKTDRENRAPVLEQWILLENDSGDIVAARNTTTFSAVREPTSITRELDGTQHLQYGFVDPEYRALKLGQYTMRLAEDAARKFLSAQNGRPVDEIDFIQICEQNDPLRMSPRSLLLDTAGSQTDQFWRRQYYESLGFRELAFSYIQLPLKPRDEGGTAYEGLSLIARGVPGERSNRGMKPVLDQVPAHTLKFSLYNFFDVATAGRYDIESDPDWIRQEAGLRGNIPCLSKQDFHALQKEAWQALERFIKNGSFNQDGFAARPLGELLRTRAAPLPPPASARPTP